MPAIRGGFWRVRLGDGPKGDGAFWVDDLGHWNQFDPNLPSSASNHNFDASVRERQIAFGLMGMVRVDLNSSNKSVDVRWNLRAADDGSLDAVADHLDFFCPEYKVRLFYFADAWNGETYDTARQAAERMQASRLFQKIKLSDRYFIKERPLDLPLARSVLIGEGLKRFEQADGQLSHPALRALMPYLLVYKPENDHDDLSRMRTLNAGVRSANAKVYGRQWAQEATGAHYDWETPGAYFSMRTSEAYGQVLDDGDPRLDHIRAIMERPDNEPVWAAYQRLLFRGRLDDGSAALVCLCDLSDRVDIPFMCA